MAGGHVGAAFHAAAVAEQRHHALQAQLFVEVGAADVHAAGGEDVVLAVVVVTTVRRQAHQGEVGRTTADVDDQYQLFPGDGGLVVERGGNRLVLERDVLEADLARHVDQGVFRFLVGHRVIIDKEHRAAQHHFFELAARRGFGAALELADKQRQQVGERHGRAQYAGVVLDQLGTQQALERAHQAAFVVFQVFVQGQAAIHRAALLEVEEHHRRQGDLVVLQRDKRLLAGADPADGGVGRAEVDAAGTGWGWVFHVYRVPVEKRPRSVCQSSADA